MKVPAHVLKWATAAAVPVAVYFIGPWEGKSNKSSTIISIVGVSTLSIWGSSSLINRPSGMDPNVESSRRDSVFFRDQRGGAAV